MKPLQARRARLRLPEPPQAPGIARLREMEKSINPRGKKMNTTAPGKTDREQVESAYWELRTEMNKLEGSQTWLSEIVSELDMFERLGLKLDFPPAARRQADEIRQKIFEKSMKLEKLLRWIRGSSEVPFSRLPEEIREGILAFAESEGKAQITWLPDTISPFTKRIIAEAAVVWHRFWDAPAPVPGEAK